MTDGKEVEWLNRIIYPVKYETVLIKSHKMAHKVV
jgi:hypothetical protein